MCLLTICVSSWRSVYSPLPILKSGLFVCLFWSCRSSLYILDIVPLLAVWFLSFHRLPFHSVDCVLWCTEVLNFDSLIYYIFSFVACAFDIISKKLLPNPSSPLLLMDDVATLFTEDLCLQLPHHSQASLSGRGVSFLSSANPFPGGKTRKEQMMVAKEENILKRKWSAVASGQPCLGL